MGTERRSADRVQARSTTPDQNAMGEPVADDCTEQRPLTEEEQASIDDLIALSSKELKWLKEH